MKFLVKLVVVLLAIFVAINCDRLNYEENVVKSIIENPNSLKFICKKNELISESFSKYICSDPMLVDSLITTLNKFDKKYILIIKFNDKIKNLNISEVHVEDFEKKYFLKFYFIKKDNKTLLHNIILNGCI